MARSICSESIDRMLFLPRVTFSYLMKRTIIASEAELSLMVGAGGGEVVVEWVMDGQAAGGKKLVVYYAQFRE